MSALGGGHVRWPAWSTEPRLTLKRRSYPAILLRSWFTPIAALVLVLVVVGIATDTLGLPFARLITLNGAGGSSVDFFDDSQVTALLLKDNLRVHAKRVGSRQAALDLDQNAFVLASGGPAATLAEQLSRTRPGKPVPELRQAFSSPLVLVTFRPYADALVRAGVANPDPATSTGSPPAQTYDVDIGGLADLIASGTSWSRLGVGPPGGADPGAVTVQTTDVCATNSAVAWMTLLASVRGGPWPPQDVASAEKSALTVRPLLGQSATLGDLEQKYLELHAQQFSRMLVVYEHEFLDRQLGTGLDSQHVMLYPRTPVENDTTVVALSPHADQLAELLNSDPDLRKRAVELGFRLVGPSAPPAVSGPGELLARRNVPVPSSLRSDTIPPAPVLPPSLPLLEPMIRAAGQCRNDPAPPVSADPSNPPEQVSWALADHDWRSDKGPAIVGWLVGLAGLLASVVIAVRRFRAHRRIHGPRPASDWLGRAIPKDVNKGGIDNLYDRLLIDPQYQPREDQENAQSTSRQRSAGMSFDRGGPSGRAERSTSQQSDSRWRTQVPRTAEEKLNPIIRQLDDARKVLCVDLADEPGRGRAGTVVAGHLAESIGSMFGGTERLSRLDPLPYVLVHGVFELGGGAERAMEAAYGRPSNRNSKRLRLLANWDCRSIKGRVYCLAEITRWDPDTEVLYGELLAVFR